MKKPFIYLVTAGLALSMIANTGTTYAVASDANVTFESPNTDGAVAPLDPENPELTLDPEEEDGNVTGATGPLTLDYVSHLNFGSEVLDLANTDELELEAVTLNPSLQVSDRRQTGEGWKVTASLSNFLSNAEERSLAGATITLNEGGSLSPINGLENPPEGLKAPFVTPSIVLTDDNLPKDIVNAAAMDDSNVLNSAQGLGTWVTSWLGTTATNENVVLKVPARTATAGDHSAEITWTLTNGPGN